ncbi:MAG: ABC transporter permease [Romboutsia sp.]|uniref:ABC transporter permease n=1 Tax=Romboutsia sp. TaxID=1965302 RepID=UPI003F350582
MKKSTLFKSKMKHSDNYILNKKIFRNDNVEVVLSCAILLFLWQIVAIKIDNDIYIPTIGQVIESLKEIVLNHKFYLDVLYSIGRCVFSFLGAVIVAVLFGLLGYTSRLFRNFIKPINAIASSIPTMVLIILSLIWFDKDKSSFIVGFLIVFPILYEAVLDAMMRIDKGIIEMANLYEVSIKDKTLKIYIPAIKIQLSGILVSTYSLALKVVIAGEVYSQPKYGMGAMIQVEKMNFNTTAIFAWLIVIVSIFIILDKISKMIERRLYIWKR